MLPQVHQADIDYHLPNEKIAFFPLHDRDQSKLLVYKDKTITDTHFLHLADFLDENCALVFNDSKVIHARLLLQNQHSTKIEVFLLEPVYPTRDIASAFSKTGMVAWKCLIGNAKKFRDAIDFDVVMQKVEGRKQKAEQEMNREDDDDERMIKITAEKGDRVGDAFLVTFMWEDETVTFAEWLEAYGKMPLPPYIKREANATDEERYQTIYARQQGSVAAPTAGLHFSESVLQSLKNKNIALKNITLHVGAGTFKPITTDAVLEHKMHQEQIVISKDTVDFLLQNTHKKVIAVGTTVARTLESLFIIGAKLFLHIAEPFRVAQFEIYENAQMQEVSVENALTALKSYFDENRCDEIYAATSLMILPQYPHKIAKGLITNFHQPKSTLLLLISSYLGADWKMIYEHALSNGYRFLSYGDSNLYISSKNF
ncbi:MAG: S-adenosylmethionine:tRNA ribosyltransferase-isomerase [Bacteroidetes bacterium]|nr:S-adenosylmethionine:tRNA ribosyltransferase-isomerase [Bacteroidota bacterium]MCL1968473.1 S-adenosylmethionine:tRNA ribosyltransferase-isomerase [Bacteroidota bacterium]